MRRHSCVLFLLLSILGLATSVSAQEVGSGGKQDSGFILEPNYPNPFNPETKIPFVLFEDLFVDGKSVVVSIRIFNVLQQFITAPTALNHPRGEGVPVLELEYPYPGRFEAYWDGRDERGRQVASGVYFVQLTVNGKTQFQRMYVTK
ncbi:MAG: hypothetical protein PVJ76_09835 [Gemmatimonadota bacterium]|jgi:hypothetical protein